MILLFLLLIYYWYFYLPSKSKPIAKPTTKLSPNQIPKYNVEFLSDQSNHFKFTVNGKTVWEHTLPTDAFTFHQDKIVKIDPCHGIHNGKSVLAKGKPLYEYLISNPTFNRSLKFGESDRFTVQSGDVFHFRCVGGRVESLEICPSGTTLVKNVCQPVNACTGKPDRTIIPHEFASQFIECFGEKETVRKCPAEHVFQHDRCESMKSLNHYCNLFPDKPFLFDDKTRIECRNGNPFFITCKNGMRFFDKDYCEPSICYGFADGEKFFLPEQTLDPFNFIPGYISCKGGKVSEITQCPQKWDSALSEGDDLTSLPMVFDGQKCSIPTFCENVFSNDADVIVPSHNFTKHVKNWKFSDLLDRAVGYVCENLVRKRKILPPEMRISKRFKAEPGCRSPSEKLPIYGDDKSFYDCASARVIACPNPTFFFNGSTCVPRPENAFSYENIPLFQFDSLNHESWIGAWDYSKIPVPQCQEPESKLLTVYNICSHPDCSNYGFVSQIPDMAILLPSEKRAKCKFYENERLLKKEEVDFGYHFWNQSAALDEEEKPCVPGQNIKSGNFIWDKTVYATCNLEQPFIFCPSLHSYRLLPVNENQFACQPPEDDKYLLKATGNVWVPFERNEIMRIWPAGNQTLYIRRNKGSSHQEVPNDGTFIAEKERLNLLSSNDVLIEPRFRVTYPPNVAFQYPFEIKTSSIDQGFLVKLKSFTSKALDFPRYKAIKHVDSFDEKLYI